MDEKKDVGIRIGYKRSIRDLLNIFFLVREQA